MSELYEQSKKNSGKGIWYIRKNTKFGIKQLAFESWTAI